MLKKYKNGFIDIIREQGMDPASFHAEDRTKIRKLSTGQTMNESVFTLRFMDTTLTFSVISALNNLHKFCIAKTRFIVEGFCGSAAFYDHVYPHDINTVYQLFARWLRDDVQVGVDEMTLPDLWTQIEQQKQLVSADRLTDYETSPFTEPEKQQLRLSINHFRMLLCDTFQPIGDQLEVIDQKLDYLVAAADRPINRFDWKGIALSTVISIAITLSLDTDKGRQLLELFKQAFSGVLNLHLLPGS